MGILSTISRSLISHVPNLSRNVSTNIPLYFNATNVLLAEPLKRKKRMDPAIIRQREERRKRKLEKQIRRLQKNAQQLKPVYELEVPYKLVDEKKLRIRKPSELTFEELEERDLLYKDWSRYRTLQNINDMKKLDVILNSQQTALDALRIESEDLYKAALEIDPGMLPSSSKGPLHTPAILNYDAPDGEYHDVTKKFEGEE